jgi:hypothetical protein
MREKTWMEQVDIGGGEDASPVRGRRGWFVVGVWVVIALLLGAIASGMLLY